MPATTSASADVRRMSTADDLIAAYRFVYEEYVRSGFIYPNPVELRLRQEFELDNHMVTFAAFHGDAIVGTMSLILNLDRLPLDDIYPERVESLRRAGVVAEVSNMVVRRDHAGTTAILRGLIREIWDECTDRSVRNIVIAVSPKHVRYFSRIFGFEPMGGPVERPPSDVIVGMAADLSTTRVVEKFQEWLSRSITREHRPTPG